MAFSYLPQNDDELELKVGDIIEVVGEVSKLTLLPHGAVSPTCAPSHEESLLRRCRPVGLGNGCSNSKRL